MWLLQFLLNQSKYIIFCGHLPSSHAFCGVLDHTRRLPECRYIVNVPQYLKWHTVGDAYGARRHAKRRCGREWTATTKYLKWCETKVNDLNIISTVKY